MYTCVCVLCMWMPVPTEARDIATEQIHLLGIELMPSARGTHALKYQAISPVTNVWIWNLLLFEDNITAFLINNEIFSLILYVLIFEKDSSLSLTMLYEINVRNVQRVNLVSIETLVILHLQFWASQSYSLRTATFQVIPFSESFWWLPRTSQVITFWISGDL